jgi:hypothetical protein
MSYRAYSTHPYSSGSPPVRPAAAGRGRADQINVGVFLVMWLLRLDGLYALLALSYNGLFRGMIWQPVTYMFLHGGFMHLLFNMFTLFFLGPETERAMGSRHFLAMYLLSGVLGGLGWIWLSPHSHALCVGASGAIYGVLAAFATLYPRRRHPAGLFHFPRHPDGLAARRGTRPRRIHARRPQRRLRHRPYRPPGRRLCRLPVH